MPTKGFVYTLTDPRDATIRYVGKTTKPLPERLAGHLASPTNPAMRLWIATLANQQMIPIISRVAEVPEARLSTEENRQIQRHARQGHRLFNSPYYRENLTDLATPPTKPISVVSESIRSDAPSPRPEYWSLYAPVVHARRRGRMPWWWVAVSVAVRAVLVSLTILWRVSLIRRAALLSLSCWFLWDIGFDLLIREQILARLPVAEALAFWSRYFQRPMTTLGLMALGMVYTRAVVAYWEVRAATPASVLPVSRASGSVAKPDAVDIAAAAAAALDSAALTASSTEGR